jgi:hypothetical protein
MNTGAMSGHTLDSGSVTLLDDIDMEDLSDLTEALPPRAAPHESNDARSNTNDMEDGTRVPPAGMSTHQTQDDAPDHTRDMTGNDDTRADPDANLKQQNHAASDDEAARLRLQQFISTFATQEVELKLLAPPPQCSQFPGQETDILEAFLDHATFTVKIWTNFDAAENVFFEGARAEACGKLQIPQAKLDSLLRLDAKEINFRNVRLDICTPFRTLARIYMNVRENRGDALLDVDGEMVELYPPRALIPLREFLEERVKRFNNVGVDRNLEMQDLVGIARLFRRRHEDGQEEDEWESPRYGGGEWAGVEEPTFNWGVRW